MNSTEPSFEVLVGRSKGAPFLVARVELNDRYPHAVHTAQPGLQAAGIGMFPNVGSYLPIASAIIDTGCCISIAMRAVSSRPD